MKSPDELLKKFQARSLEILNRLDEFKGIMKDSDERIFEELAFCLCTPQSKATVCWNAVTALVKNDLLFTGSKEKIRPFLNAVRFGDNKSGYIVEARQLFPEMQIKQKILSMPNPVELREGLFGERK